MRKVKMLTVASMLLIGSSTLAFAGPGPQHGMGMGYSQDGGCMMNMGQRGGNWGLQGGHMGIYGALDLTPEQQQKMKDILAQYRDLRSDRSANQNIDNDIYNMLNADSFDEAKVRKQIEDNAKPMIDRQVEIAKIHYQMYQVLTPEQKAKVKAFHEQRMEQWKKRMDWRANNKPVKPNPAQNAPQQPAQQTAPQTAPQNTQQ